MEYDEFPIFHGARYGRVYVGKDCPSCGAKGVVFRCPRRNQRMEGPEFADYICMACTLHEGEGCTSFGHDLRKQGLDEGEFWNSTPEISMDLYNLVVSLLRDRADLEELRKIIRGD